MRLDVQLLLPEATVPTKGSAGAAGWDLYAAEDAVIECVDYKTVETGVAIALPEDHVGLIWPRSGLAAKHGVDTLAGVIDSDYRGGIGVVLVNHGWEAFEVEPGMRIAQLLVQRVEGDALMAVPELTGTQRDVRGFGSTGS